MFNNSFALINFVLILFCEQPVNRPLVERGTREREKPFPCYFFPQTGSLFTGYLRTKSFEDYVIVYFRGEIIFQLNENVIFQK